MGRRPSLTDEQKDLIAELREGRGWSYARIAIKLKIAEGSVSWYCLKQGIEKPGRKIPVLRQPQTKPFTRHGRTVRPFSPEEDAKMLELSAEGLKPAAIARALGNRRPNSITGRLYTLARHQDRADASQGIG